VNVDPYAVTAQEAAEYDSFCHHHLAYLNRYPPDSLWYYTTAATFAVIMESKSIWATQISCLNDHMEFRHGVRLVRDAIRLYKVPPHDKDTQWLAGYVDDALEYEGAEISEFFVLCMSEAKDDLSQWRAYGGGENGVAIELCTPVLQPNTQHSGYLRPVWYVENAQKGLAADIAKWTVDFFRLGFSGERTDRKRWADAFLEEWKRRVVWFAPLLKDKAFAAEREWRLIVTLSGNR